MIFIKLYGADQYIGMENSEKIENYLRKECDIKDDICFICTSSYLVHAGQEQTSFQALCEVLAPVDLKPLRDKISKGLIKGLKEVTVHSHIAFRWFDREDMVDCIDHDYPDYMTKDNMVQAQNPDESQEPQEEEDPSEDSENPNIYFGNIFQELDDFVAAHPEMSKDEATLAYYDQKRKDKKGSKK